MKNVHFDINYTFFREHSNAMFVFHKELLFYVGKEKGGNCVFLFLHCIIQYVFPNFIEL